MNQDADALSRQAWNSSEGDPWRPAAVEAEEIQLRTATKVSVVGGDVGTECSAHRKKKDVVGQAHQEADKKEKGIVMQKKDIVN